MQVTESHVRSMPLPPHIKETDSFKPLSHNEALEHVEMSLNNAGLSIARDDAGEERKRVTLVSKGAKMVCTMPLTSMIDDESRLMIAIMNSYDKTLALRLGFGSEVFVCTNGCLFASKVIGCRHTTNILQNLPENMTTALNELENYKDQQQRFFDRLRNVNLNDQRAYHIVGKAARNHDCITGGEIIHVLNEWHEPSYNDFSHRNAWSLHNAFTEVSKRIANQNGSRFAERSQRLSRFFAEEFASDLNLHISRKALQSVSNN